METVSLSMLDRSLRYAHDAMQEALVCTSCFRYGPTKATKPADKITKPFGAEYLNNASLGYLLGFVGVAVDVPCITTKIWEGGKQKV